MKLIGVLIQLHFLIPIIFSFKCGFNSLPRPKIQSIIPINNTSNQNLRTLSSYHPLKIYVDYELIENSLLEETLNSIKSAFDLSLSIFQQLLSISNDGRYTFEAYQINSAHSTFTADEVPYLLENSKNIDADLFLIVSMNTLGNAQARAYPIIKDENTNRPILGVVELNTAIDTFTKNHIIFISNLLLHEISHVLAFNSDLFPYFNKLPNLQQAVSDIEINGIKRQFLSTPKVVEKANQHFNTDLLGVELEDQGGSDTAGSHWEARIMLGDYMIGVDYPEIVISDITLAVFEDSNWYKVNYYSGGLFKTGKNEGYNFLFGDCVNKNNEESNFKLEFCNNQRDPFCSPGLIDRGYCYLGIYPEDENIPKKYQYYSNPLKGGWDIANYCPVMQNDYEKANNFYYYSRCNIIGKENYTEIGEKLSNTSFCFMSSLVKSSLSEEIKSKYSNEKAICYEVIQCDNTLKHYTIKIGETEFTCTNGNNIESYEIEGFEGTITCPPYNRICSGTKLCNDLYDCVEKKIETIYENNNKKDNPDNNPDNNRKKKEEEENKSNNDNYVIDDNKNVIDEYENNENENENEKKPKNNLLIIIIIISVILIITIVIILFCICKREKKNTINK